MSSSSLFLRRSVFVKRVAPFCGMFALLPLMGCGSYVPPFQMSGAEHDGWAKSGLKGHAQPVAFAPSAPAPSSAKAETYGHLPASASLAPARIERASLAPLAAPATAEPVVPVSYAFAATMPLGLHGAGRTGPDAQLRQVSEHGRQKRPPYAPEDADQPGPERAAPRSDYLPEGAYREADAAGTGEYVVQPGDTLYDIGRQHGLSADELMEINGLSGSHIEPGQRLRLDGRGAPAEPKAQREARPDPRSYREPAEPRGMPYREPQGERYAQPPQGSPRAYVYEPEPGPATGPRRQVRPDGPDPREARRPSGPDHGDYAPPRGRGYEEPRQARGRESAAPDYTASNRGYTPDGPFEPSPDAPWRGEAEWRRLDTRPANRPESRQETYERRPEPRYESRPGPRYGGRPDPQEDYDGRGDYQPRPVTRAPYEPPRGYAPAPQAAAPGSRGGAYVHRVRRGETLVEIARRNGLDQRELAAFNGLPPDVRLRAGQELQIPQGQGYDWDAPRGEPERRSPPRQRYPASSAKPERPEVRAAAAPATPPARSLPQAHAKTAEPAPARHAARHAAPEAVEEAPDAAPEGPAPEAAASRVAVATTEPPTTPLAEPAALTPAENVPPRECETLLANPEPRSAKSFRLPVQGVVISKFGAKDDGSFNDGINFSVPKGTPVKAAENGVVAYAGDELPGFGNLVLIRHADGYVTAYAHNDELLVKKCDVVKRGQIISKAGATGTVKPQLHFELRKESKPIDPESHFAGT